MAEAENKADGWEKTREVISAGKVDCEYRQAAVRGTWVMEAYPREVVYAAPLGNVWFRFVGNKTIELLGSFVNENVRRCGLRTLMHERMREEYPENRFITALGNEMSTPWLEKMGFQKDPHTEDWTFTPEKESDNG